MMASSNRAAELTHDPTSPVRSKRRAVTDGLDGRIQAHLGQQLRAWYGDPAEHDLPSGLARLLDRVAQVLGSRAERIDQTFRDGLVASVPSLRKFAISLARDIDLAEDLVQETVLKAISKHDSFEPGTCLQAWLFTILRNNFFSARRKSMREELDEDGSRAATMICVADQEDRIMIQDVAAALRKLPKPQRDAIVLVGAEGLSYEEAAQALGCAVGTVKSRVNRARTYLAQLISLE